MKRRTRQLVVFLLLGAMTNVLLAWGLAIWSPRKWNNVIEVTGEEAVDLWNYYAPRDWLTNPEAKAVIDSTYGMRMLKLFAWPRPDSASSKSSNAKLVVVWSCGWPRPAFYCRLPYTSDPLPPIEKAWNLRWDVLGKRCWMVPYGPEWKGIFFNTACFSMVYLLCFWGPIGIRYAARGWRHSRRRKRGLCPACAYPIGTSPVCTECGKPVRTQKAEIA